jgi:hypothetical protein
MLQNAPMYSYIPAKDVARARAFYEEKLGFKPKEVAAAGVTYEFANGTACFRYPTPNAGTSQASQDFCRSRTSRSRGTDGARTVRILPASSRRRQNLYIDSVTRDSEHHIQRFVKQFDDDCSKRVLKPSSLNKTRKRGGYPQ